MIIKGNPEALAAYREKKAKAREKAPAKKAPAKKAAATRES